MQRLVCLLMAGALASAPAAAQFPDRPAVPGSQSLRPSAREPGGFSPAPWPTRTTGPLSLKPSRAADAPSQPGEAHAPATPALQTFEPAALELRWVEGKWLLVAEGIVLKDFGSRQAEAREAMRLIHTLHLTQHGTVGKPQPVIEYWLSEGKAPHALNPGARLLAIDPASLCVESIQGQWCVRDGNRVFFNFGASQADAQEALEVLRHYGFTQVGFVGLPRPLMMYFLGGQTAFAGAPRQPAPVTQPREGPWARFQKESLASLPQLAPPAAPGVPLHFDPSRVEVKRDGEQWRLVWGARSLASFANEYDARQAQTVVRSYHFTEQCFVGTPPSFSYFLVHGQPPAGLRYGLVGQPLGPGALDVRKVGDRWMLCQGDLPLLDFGDRPQDGRELIELIHHYGFNQLCRVGPFGPQSLTFLIRDH